MNNNFNYRDHVKRDLVCFSHLRWDFVYQRPQHLMSRFAKHQRVFFVEEPVLHEGSPSWVFSNVEENVTRCIPKLPSDSDRSNDEYLMRYLLRSLSDRWSCKDCILWFYTPMMVDWADELDSAGVVYDCMDELRKFRFAPTELKDREQRLFERADLVFTGGHSLYLAKKDRHDSVYEFPSSIDTSHFRQARLALGEPDDQAHLPGPRIGYAGVIDERIDLDLLAEAADLRPKWTYVMLGPVVKVDPESLPQRPNIHYLGMKNYEELPKYLGGWDVGMMPFALNESTEFISPTKTPEYLASGIAVVSTPIADVVRPYGELGLVEVASGGREFVAAIERAMKQKTETRLRDVDLFLSERSWDRTCKQMEELIAGIGKVSPTTGAFGARKHAEMSA